MTTPNPPSSALNAAREMPRLSVFRRLMCKMSLCGGFMDHAKDENGVWWIGLRCATCGVLHCPLKSQFQDPK